MAERQYRYDTKVTQAELDEINNNYDVRPAAHDYLEDKHMPLWKSIIAQRDPTDWTVVDLTYVAELCRLIIEFNELRSSTANQPEVTSNSQGNPMRAPHIAVLDNMTRRIQRMSDALKLTSDERIKRRVTKKRSTEVTKAQGFLEPKEGSDAEPDPQPKEDHSAELFDLIKRAG